MDHAIQNQLIQISPPEFKIEMVELSKIDIPEIKEEKHLTRSIEVAGLYKNVLLKKIGERYEVIVGRRTVISAAKAGASMVPAFVLNSNEVTPAMEAIYILTENMHRKPNPVCEAEAIKTLLSNGYDEKAISKILKINKKIIRQRLQLLNLIPELLEMARRGEISITIAQQAARLSPMAQQKLLEMGVNKNNLEALRNEDYEEMLDLFGVDDENTEDSRSDSEYDYQQVASAIRYLESLMKASFNNKVRDKFKKCIEILKEN